MNNVIGLHRIALISSLFVLAGLAGILTYWKFDGASRVVESAVDIPPARLAALTGRLPLITECRQLPIRVLPNPGLEDVVSDFDLALALNASLPQWNPPAVPSLIHELRLWGPDCIFTNEMIPVSRTGRFMTDVLLSDSLCRKHTVQLGGSYLLDSPFGIRPVRVGSVDAEQLRGEGHFGQLLKNMAEAGIPSYSQVVSESGRTGTLADVLQDAIMRFSLKTELEFISDALVLWLPPTTQWSNRFAEQFTFDDLAVKLIGEPTGEGACAGCHLPYSIALLIRVDDDSRILSPDIRRLAEERLKEFCRMLEDSFDVPPQGWKADWSGRGTIGGRYNELHLDRINVIGHHLEWIAIAPPDSRPSKEVIGAGVSELSTAILDLPDIRTRQFKSLLPCSHAARALCMLRNEDPYRVWRAFWDAGRLSRSARMGYQLNSD